MWWGKSKDPKPEEKSEVVKSEVVKSEVAQIKDTVAEKLPTKERISHGIQDAVNQTGKNGNVFDDITEGYGPDSTDTNLRYAAYATRIRTILLSAHRYVAYTSEIGESFRPVAHPGLVRGAYAVSWLYLIGDVSYEGYKSYWHNQRILNPKLQLTPHQEKVTGLPAVETRAVAPGTVPPLEDWRTVMVQRGIFQSIASMGLPAYTIHTVVRYSGRAMKNMKNKTIRTWGPVGLGLAVVPFLPAMFDEPVENAVEWAFHKGFETFGGKAAVGNAPMTGREDLLAKRPKEKEL